MKRARQTEVRTLKNRSVRNMIKTLSKKVEKEVKNKSRESAEAALTTVVSAIDKAAKKRVLHRNTASRKVSRLSKLVNSMLPSEAA
ncbi:MAG TPA: 30S ribosomal protein S20 [Nitrospirae bacterium]|nr:30S ribosomal protein S20 [Nitrospirota bacterium]